MVLHLMMREQDGPTFARQLAMFLPVARKSPANYACVLGLVIAPAVALIVMGGPDQAAFWLTTAALVAAIAGPLLTSMFLAEPNYEVILAWDPERMPSDWRATRSRYFSLNWLRGALTWVAFGCLLTALVVYV
jgi:hypothetical protein